MVTMEDLKAFDANRWIEVVDGEIVEHDRFATGNMQHIFIIKRLFRMIDSFVTEHQLGEVFQDGLTYVLEERHGVVNRARIPDFSFIRKSSFPKTHDLLGPFPVPPTLAAEVTFPQQAVYELHKRTRDYLEAGVEEVWTIFDRTQEVHRYCKNDPNTIHVYHNDDSIVSDKLFPGLEIPVSQLFDQGNIS